MPESLALSPGTDFTTGSPSDAVLAVLDLVGMSRFALESLVSVAELSWSDQIPTACLTAGERPRILFNPGFVRAHCTTPERLAMLILHELAHHGFAHMRMTPHVTRAQNIAFDAIINRSVLQHLWDRGADMCAYLTLLESLYRPDSAPSFLLRPPLGWHPNLGGGHEAPATCPAPLRAIHRRLYAPVGRGCMVDVTYGEIVEALDVTRAVWERLEQPMLLGSHGEQHPAGHHSTDLSRDSLPHRFRRTFTALSSCARDAAGPGSAASDRDVTTLPPAPALIHSLRSAFRNALVPGGTGMPRATKQLRASLSVWPARDRRALAKRMVARALGAPMPLLFCDEGAGRSVERQTAFIYCDVSGSMHGYLPALLPALAPLRDELDATVWQFSTEVEPLSGRDLRAGRVRTTGGTDVTPVLLHLLRNTRRLPKRVVLVTDGYFHKPPLRLIEAVRTRGTEVHVIVVERGSTHGVSSWAASVTRVETRRAR